MQRLTDAYLKSLESLFVESMKGYTADGDIRILTLRAIHKLTTILAGIGILVIYIYRHMVQLKEEQNEKEEGGIKLA